MPAAKKRITTKKKVTKSNTPKKATSSVFSARPGVIAVLAGLLILIGGFYVLLSRAATVVPPVAADAGKEWSLVFNEDFDGTTLDLNKWTPCFSWAWDYNYCTASFNNGREVYRSSQVQISNGTARLVAEPQPKDEWGKDYKSGLLSTTNKPASLTGGKPGPSLFKFTYGYVEARMKMPREKGFFTAFWMLPVGSPDNNYAYAYEVDIVEALGGNDPYAYQTVHYANRSKNFKAEPYGRCQEFTADSLYGNFHTFGVDWQPGYIDFYIDGKKCSRFTAEVWKTDMELILNHMVDVDWQKLYPGLSGASGKGVLEVDYVKVWQQKAKTTTTTTVTPTTTTTVTPTTTATVSPSPTASPTPSNKPPVGPVSLSATATSASQINLSWPAATDESPGTLSYVLTRNGTKVYSGPNLSFPDTGLAAATTYNYQVVAIDVGLLPSTGATATAKTLVAPAPPTADTINPSQPTNVKGKVQFDATRFSYFTNLTWSPSFDNVGVTSYEVKRNNVSLGTSTTTSFKDYNLQPNTLYTYDIYARDAAGLVSAPGTARLTGRCFLIWCWSE